MLPLLEQVFFYSKYRLVQNYRYTIGEDAQNYRSRNSSDVINNFRDVIRNSRDVSSDASEDEPNHH